MLLQTLYFSITFCYVSLSTLPVPFFSFSIAKEIIICSVPLTLEKGKRHVMSDTVVKSCNSPKALWMCVHYWYINYASSRLPLETYRLIEREDVTGKREV